MSHVFQLDTSLERKIHDERLDGRRTLVDDLKRGFYAKAIIAERAHSAIARREACVWGGDLEARLEYTTSAAAFHTLGQKYGYDCWDDQDFVNWRLNRFPEARVRHVPRKPVIFVGSKYGPPAG